jgi:hypothetical protein
MLDSMMDECINNKMETKDKKKNEEKKTTHNKSASRGPRLARLIDKYANIVAVNALHSGFDLYLHPRLRLIFR